MSDEIVLYRSVGSRSITALWLLEEIGVPYRTETRDIKKGENRDPAYLKINPFGKAPTLKIGDQVTFENPAICLLLADRYAYGTLAPKLEEAARGPYMTWTVWATSALEPASALGDHDVPPKVPGAWHFGFGKLEGELDALEAALAAGGGHLAGGRFTAADVMVGSVVAMRLFTGEIPQRPPLADYFERLSARPAFKRAADLNWPPAEFAHVQPAP
jgi:glutathione S-transferase